MPQSEAKKSQSTFRRGCSTAQQQAFHGVGFGENIFPLRATLAGWKAVSARLRIPQGHVNNLLRSAFCAGEFCEQTSQGKMPGDSHVNCVPAVLFRGAVNFYDCHWKSRMIKRAPS